MEQQTNELITISISVRELVEFILRSGDIDNRAAHGDMGAMQEGSRLHRKLQKEAGGDYKSEVALKEEVVTEYGQERFKLRVEGRADGIFTEECGSIPTAMLTDRRDNSFETAGLAASVDMVFIDEIKTVLRPIDHITEPVAVHRSQAMCYAYIYGRQEELSQIGIRMTYCNQDTEEIKYFYEIFDHSELCEWFERLTREYAKWAAWEAAWIRERNASILKAKFPFTYRAGQRELVSDVYKTINRGKRLFVEAPTGVGKTISTVFPALWALGEGKCSKLFYATAKTIARTVAEETFKTLIDDGMHLKCVTITSKEKICVLEKPDCNPIACERARGHFDRVNDAVYDMLTHEERIDRGLIEEYAAKHSVCPFEMCLDVTSWSDAIVCDYNYIFDPTVHLKRFFDGAHNDYGFLIDEAHNLVERAREMYSAQLIKEDFLTAKAALSGGKHTGLTGTTPRNRAATRLSSALEACNKTMLAMKRECDSFEVWEECDKLVLTLMKFAGAYEDCSKDLTREENEAVLELYFNARHFLNMYDVMQDDYTIYSDYTENRSFRVRLQCMDPSNNLSAYLEMSRSTVFFSATLLPIKYYMEQLGGRSDDYCVYAPSPFDTGKRLLMIGRDVSTRYTRRNDSEYARITEYIRRFVNARKGNYMVFFPSYSMMESVAAAAADTIPGICMQGRQMSEEEKENFLNSFSESPDETRVGFCVMGGIFAEGIDLKNDRLIGVVVVGTGLPMVCNERELFRGYFDEKIHRGFEYAYLYNGMNKVMQAAGRVIRTTEDTGAILLLDERFLSRQYKELFPIEWSDYKVVTIDTVNKELEDFWKLK